MSQPVEHLDRVPIRRKHWIEDLRDDSLFGYERQSLVEPALVELERRERQRRSEYELLVTDNWEGHPGPRGEFLLFRHRL
jgi:hypothetical protein